MIKPREIERALNSIDPELSTQLIFKCLTNKEKNDSVAKIDSEGYSENMNTLGEIDVGKRIVEELQKPDYKDIDFTNLEHGLEDAGNKSISDIIKKHDVSAESMERINKYCVGEVVTGFARSGALRVLPTVVNSLGNKLDDNQLKQKQKDELKQTKKQSQSPKPSNT
jgi:hypothetical protein